MFIHYTHVFYKKFFITCAKCDFLDGKHVVFGRIVDGLLTLRKIENMPCAPNNRPKVMYTTLLFNGLVECTDCRMWTNVNKFHFITLKES